MSLEFSKYIPTAEEFSTAEALMTDKQKQLTDKRWNKSMHKICGKKQKELKRAIDDRYESDDDFVSRGMRIDSLEDLAGGDPLHRHHHKSRIEHMNQREYVEWLIKDLSDTALVMTTSQCHSSGAMTSEVVTVGEIRKSLPIVDKEKLRKELLEKDLSEEDIEEEINREECSFGFGAVCGWYHDCDNMKVLGEIPKTAEEIKQTIQRVGPTIFYGYFSPGIEEKKLPGFEDISYKILPNDITLVRGFHDWVDEDGDVISVVSTADDLKEEIVENKIGMEKEIQDLHSQIQREDDILTELERIVDNVK